MSETTRLLSGAEVADNVRRALLDETIIDYETARTIASYWHSPSPHDHNITALSHGVHSVLSPSGLIGEVERYLRIDSDLPTRDIDSYHELIALLEWAQTWEATPITVVWSAYGHRFQSTDSPTDERCITCGAMFELSHDDPTDFRHGYYHAANGDQPMECTNDTNMAHGYPGEIMCDACDDGIAVGGDSLCEHCHHECNCLFCDS